MVPLIENGEEIEVTEDNKMKYLDLLAQHRLVRSVKEETEAFLKGEWLVALLTPGLPAYKVALRKEGKHRARLNHNVSGKSPLLGM